MSDTIFVLDLGGTKVTAAAFDADGAGSLRLVTFAAVPCAGLAKGVVTDMEATIEAVQSAVGQVRSITSTTDEAWIVSINGSHLEGSNTQGLVPIYPRTRVITRDDVLQVLNHSRQVLPAPDREQIQAIPREFRVDGQKGVTRPVGMTGGRLEVVTHVVTGLTSHIQSIQKILRISGVTPAEFVPQPIAASLGVVDAQSAEQGCVVVDIGVGTTSVGIMTGGVIAYSAVIPVGSGAVTNDLSKLLKCSVEIAERLKTQEGSALSTRVGESETVEISQIGQLEVRYLPRKVLCEIIESRLREILQMVKAHIERSGLNGLLPGGIIFTGGGSRIPLLPQLSEEVIKHMSARCGGPEIAGTVNKQFIDPANSVTVGLARFVFAEEDEELAPSVGLDGWKLRIANVIKGHLKAKS